MWAEGGRVCVCGLWVCRAECMWAEGGRVCGLWVCRAGYVWGAGCVQGQPAQGYVNMCGPSLTTFPFNGTGWRVGGRWAGRSRRHTRTPTAAPPTPVTPTFCLHPRQSSSRSVDVLTQRQSPTHAHTPTHIPTPTHTHTRRISDIPRVPFTRQPQ